VVTDWLAAWQASAQTTTVVTLLTVQIASFMGAQPQLLHDAASVLEVAPRAAGEGISKPRA
jgi:hypothetical protein